MPVNTRIQLRRGTVASGANQWSTQVLSQGEVGFESDTGKFKIGDGTTAWNSLGYASVLPSELNELVDDRVNALLVAGSNISLTYDDSANTLTIATDGLDTEQVEDIIGSKVVGGSGISVSYNDSTGVTTVSLSDPTIQLADITDLDADIATFLATPTSDNLRAAIDTSTTGTGALVFGTSPTIGGTASLNNLDVSGLVNFNNTTDSSSTATGSLVVDGGVGIAKKLYVGGAVSFAAGLSITGSTTIAGALAATSLGINGLPAINSDGSIEGTSATISGTIKTTSGGVDKVVLTNSGTGSFASDVTVGGTLGVTGNTTLSGTLGVTGNTTLSGDLGVTGDADVSGNLDVTGNADVTGTLTIGTDLIVNGSTITANSTVVTIDDPVFTLGGDTAPTVDDNKDRGIEFRYFDGSAKLGFFGYDDSTGKFTFIPDATNTSEVFSGTKGEIDANVDWSNVLNKPDPVVTVTLTGDVTGTANTTLTDLASGTVEVATTITANSVALGTDTTGNYVATVAAGSYATVSGSGSETAAVTVGVDATSANTASKVVARDASGNFSAGNITATGLTDATLTNCVIDGGTP